MKYNQYSNYMRLVLKLINGLGNKLSVLTNGLYIGKKYKIKVYVVSITSPHEKSSDIYNLKILTGKNIETIYKYDSVENYNKKIYTNKYITFMKKLKESKYTHIRNPYDCIKAIKKYKYNTIVHSEYYAPLKFNDYKDFLLEKYKHVRNYTTIFKFVKNIIYVGVHIRTGDFIHQNMMDNNRYYLLKENYYVDIINKITKSKKTYKILFFTNDENNFIENHVLKNIKINYEIIKTNTIDEIITLSRCNYLILSKSTFSLWAGLLSTYKTIYMPKTKKQIYDKYSKWNYVNIFDDNNKYIINKDEIKYYFPISFEKYMNKIT